MLRIVVQHTIRKGYDLKKFTAECARLNRCFFFFFFLQDKRDLFGERSRFVTTPLLRFPLSNHELSGHGRVCVTYAEHFISETGWMFVLSGARIVVPFRLRRVASLAAPCRAVDTRANVALFRSTLPLKKLIYKTIHSTTVGIKRNIRACMC